MVYGDMVLRVPNTPHRRDDLDPARGCLLAMLMGTLLWTAIILIVVSVWE